MSKVDLDEEQSKVVEYTSSLVVEAGPGSGKTRVLTEKARKVFNQNKDILCLCFTRAAAREMASRVPGLPAATIHSYCCGVVGWEDNWGYTGLLTRFLWTRNKRQFDWVLLDECQDVNELELDVVLSLVGGNLFAVGDTFQSIYGFQGALGPDVINYLDSMNIRVKSLKNNYRSAPYIVDKLNKVYSRGLVSKGIKENGLTAILTRTNEDLFYVSRELKELSIPHVLRLSVERADEAGRREFSFLGESNLRLSTIHSSKGLEFDKVILYGWLPSSYGEEKRVHYVAMSRASMEYYEVDNTQELLVHL